MLDARLDSPPGAPVAYALFAHCFTCAKESVAATRISRALAQKDIAVLRFDFTGLGGSEGEFANTNFSSNVLDLVRAAAYLRQSARAPALLIGHSLGGAAVLSAAADIPEAKAVVTIGAPSEPDHVRHLFAENIDEVIKHGEQTVTLGGRQFLIRRQFLDDLTAHPIAERIRGLNRALLILHSPQDETVDIGHARTIYESALHPKSFISLYGANHLLSREQDAEYAASLVSAWVHPYLPTATGETAEDRKPRTVFISEADQSGFAQDISIGPHYLRGDEPVSFGGDDSGPSPYDLLLASLGACTAMTLRMYARHKKLALEHVEVELSHSKIHASDCSECETKKGKIDRIDRRIYIEGELDDAQRKRLLEIADRCPIHQTLHSEVVVDTSAGKSLIEDSN